MAGVLLCMLCVHIEHTVVASPCCSMFALVFGTSLLFLLLLWFGGLVCRRMAGPLFGVQTGSGIVPDLYRCDPPHAGGGVPYRLPDAVML